MRKRNGAARKLRSRKGESIAETLVAMLIAALATVMFVAMLNAAAHMVENSRKSVDAYYKANNVLSAQTSSPTGTVTVTLENESGTAINISPGYSGGTVSCYQNEKAPKVVAYKP